MRAVVAPYLHVLAGTDWLESGSVFDTVVALDPLFGGSLRITEGRVHALDPALWPEWAGSGAQHIVVLQSSLVQTIAGAVASTVTWDGENGDQYREPSAMRRAELAENAAEEASVARAFRGTEPTPIVAIWSDDPRTERLGY